MTTVLAAPFPLGSEKIGTVSGKVFDAGTSSYVSGASVTVEAECLDGTLTTIGETTTDADGAYSVSYDLDDLQPCFVKVTVTSLDGSPTKSVVSPSTKEDVSFKLGGAGSTNEVAKYTDLKARIAPVLTKCALELGDLDALGLAKLGLAAGVPPAHVALAHEAEKSASLSSLPASLFFAAGSGGLSAVVSELIKHSPAERERAVNLAVANRVLSAADEADAMAGLESLKTLATNSASVADYDADVATPGLVLKLAGVIDDTERATILATWQAHTGSVDDFWTALDLDSDKKAKAQFGLHLDALTRSNAKLVKHLFDTYAAPEDLAALKLSDWQTLVGTYPTPQYLVDGGANSGTYARAMFSAVEDAFPTPMLLARKDDFSATLTDFGPGLEKFLGVNPSYDLAGQSFNAFMDANATALDTLTEDEKNAVKGELPILERLYRIVPRGDRFETMRILRDPAINISSATQIQLLGKARFLTIVTPSLESTVAAQVYRKAVSQSSLALGLRSAYVPSKSGRFAALPSTLSSDDPLEGATSPVTWERLFGGRSFCSCEECQSAHGAAAYLADLLFWLRTSNVETDLTDPLLARRPDIGSLELSCKNTNTPLPAIDLILEQLEELVAPTPGVSLQTTLDAAELAARPEHVNTAAYERLARKNAYPVFYPFDQPYVAALDQMRTFLRALGVERSIAMMTLKEGGVVPALDEPRIAAEVLGLTRTSWAILAGQIPAPSVGAAWGLEADLFGHERLWSEGVAVTDATVAYLDEETDPEGGNNAVQISDADGQTRSSTFSRRGTHGTSLWTFYVKHGGTGTPEFRVGFEGDYSDPDRTFTYDFGTNDVSSASGLDDLDADATTVSGWSKITFKLAAPSQPSAVGLKVTPASGGAANTGSLIIYGPRVTVTARTFGSAPQALTTSSLKTVETFLTYAADRAAEAPLTYADFEDLFCSQYVQEAGAFSIDFDNTTCDIAGASIVAEGFDDHLKRLAKIIRLSRDIGWSIRDVDRAIVALRGASPPAETNINESLLKNLARIEWLRRQFKLSVADILDWWAPLDTRRWKERLADVPTVDLPEGIARRRIKNGDFANAGGSEAEPSPFQWLARPLPTAALFELLDDGSELAADPLKPLADNLDAVAGLIGVSPSVLGPFLRYAGSADLSLANIAILKRHSTLALALGLTSEELVEWRGWLGSDPFASPDATVDFVTEVSRNATLRLPQRALRQVLGAEGVTRDLSVLQLPRTADALIALANELRAQLTTPTSAVTDVGTADDQNLLPSDWLPTNTTLTNPTVSGPSGISGTAGDVVATLLVDEDDGPSPTESFATLAATATVGPATVVGTLWLKKPDTSPTCFAEVALQYDDTAATPAEPERDRIAIHLGSGSFRVQSGSFADVSVQEVAGWWRLTFRHENVKGTIGGGTGLSPLSLLVFPAAGEYPPVLDDDGATWTTSLEAVGSATVYGGSLAVPALARDRALVRKTAALLNADVGLVGELLARTVYGAGSTFKALLDVTTRLNSSRSADPTRTIRHDDVVGLAGSDVWELVALSAWMCRAFGIRVEDLDWLVGSTASAERGFDIEHVVLEGAITDRYTAWRKLREAARLQQVARKPGKQGRLFDLFADWVAGVAPAAVRAGLVERTNWTDDDLKAAIGVSAFDGLLFDSPPPSSAELATPATFARLAGWMELAGSLGVPAATLWRWSQLAWPEADGVDPVDEYETFASEIEHALRGAWGSEKWLSDIPRVREDLRNRQRHALLSRIVGDPSILSTDEDLPFVTADNVGQYLLMDVQLGSCMQTSRIKDAIRTVQVLVERVLIGEEPDLHLGETDSQEWVWRKNFRVWQANRKVFLYPENWLRPELRKDKTPFFAGIESALAQGDLREELVEDAYREYLRKLSDVSKLETLALLDEATTTGTVYHVFARTRTIPYSYWHRTRENGGKWTPWTEIPKVEGEHLIPVVFQRRLMLFWLNVSETTEPPPPMEVPAPAASVPGPQRYFMIRPSWSEFRDGRWSAPNKSETFIGLDEHGEASCTVGELAFLVSDGTEPQPLETTFAEVNLAALKIQRDIASMGSMFGGGPSAELERQIAEAEAEVDSLPHAATGHFPPACIYGQASRDDARHDLVLRLFRTFSFGQSAQLQGFRISGIDGSVAVEPVDTSFSSSIRPRDYGSDAQAFRTSGTGDTKEFDLALPESHPSAAGPVYRRVLLRDTNRMDDWVRVTPLQRAFFNATQPFVFDDNFGGYWVTYAPPPLLSNSAHFGWLFTDTDLALKTPAASDLRPNAIIRPLARFDPVRIPEQAGSTSLVDASTLGLAQWSGGTTVSLNGNELDTSRTEYAITTLFAVANESGDLLHQSWSGSTAAKDGKIVVVKGYSINTTTSPSEATTGGWYDVRNFNLLNATFPGWRFDTFYHPYVGAMRETLNRLGVFGLIDPPADATPREKLDGQNPTPDNKLSERYQFVAVRNDPADDLDFAAGGAYSQYNWELFFHAPFLIATRLHEAGKFEQALQWLKLIFDPFRPAREGEAASESARSFWRFRPFREEFALEEGGAPRNIQQLIAILSADGTDPDVMEQARALVQQVTDWRRNPFDPHAIARTRVMTYMTAVVMKFLDVLIDWGDELFARDTLESVGEAAEYYLLAARLLGPKPEEIKVGHTDARSINRLFQDFDDGITATAGIEENVRIEAFEQLEEDSPSEASSLATLYYFCIPANPDLTPRYWGRVADRLFKLRNCLDIQGNKRILALFEPPIDPDLLVRAAASGADLQSALADIVTGRVPHRRYLAMAELAAGLASGAQGLGQALLSSIERRDADQLNTLRNVHERRLQEDAIQARTDQITDLQHQIESLQANRDAVAARLAFYKDKPRTNPKEDQQHEMAVASTVLFAVAGGLSTAASIIGLFPKIDSGLAGVGGTPVLTVGTGGPPISAALQAGARGLETAGGIVDRVGSMTLTQSGYDRRKEEWDLQARLAEKDLAATDARMLSMQIQIAMANNALASANLRMTQIDQIQDFLERRFARDDLYDWMASELSGLHYQSYQLAYEFAKKAEKAWQYELGRNDSFIQFGYWDSGRRGLLAADRLGHDLRRMQVAYSELSTKRLEVEQTFSLREIDPVGLLTLQQTGTVDFEIPEAFFDLYYPGHYRRRIRAVRLSIPAVVPPNANVPAHVEQPRHRIRKTDGSTDADLVEGGYGTPPVTMTATSSAQRDGGVFELDFKAPRLLPFEGTGAVSSWRITLPRKVRPFRYSDIQDALLHIAYDAEYSGTLREYLDPSDEDPGKVLDNLLATTPPRTRVISLRQEYGGVWRRFIQAGQATPQGTFSVSIDITDAVYPAYLRGHVSVASARLVLVTKKTERPVIEVDTTAVSWTPPDDVAGFPAGVVTLTGDELVGMHTFEVTSWGSGAFVPEDDADLLLVVEFE